MEQYKKCTKCLENKNLEEFYNHKISIDGKHTSCKECDRDRQKKWRKNNLIKDAAKSKRYKDKNRKLILGRYKESVRELKISYVKERLRKRSIPITDSTILAQKNKLRIQRMIKIEYETNK